MKKLLMIFFALLGTLFLLQNSSAQEEAKYIGAEKCKMCHMNKARGDQWGKWQTGPHAKAFETLGTEEAKAVAKKAGVEGRKRQPVCSAM